METRPGGCLCAQVALGASAACGLQQLLYGNVPRLGQAAGMSCFGVTSHNDNSLAGPLAASPRTWAGEGRMGEQGAPGPSWSALLSCTPVCGRGCCGPVPAFVGHCWTHEPLPTAAPEPGLTPLSPCGLTPLGPSPGLLGSPLGVGFGKRAPAAPQGLEAPKGKKEDPRSGQLSRGAGGHQGQRAPLLHISYRGLWFARCFHHHLGLCSLQTPTAASPVRQRSGPRHGAKLASTAP